jgi:16S rRNA (uracil1498-N3)-methyltransferase
VAAAGGEAAVRRRRVRLQRLRGGRVRVAPDEAHHLARVLRARPGDPVQAFDGAGREADGRVAAVAEGAVELELEPPRPSEREAPLALTLAVALLKGDKLAQVARQATELGVAELAPTVTRRCDAPRLSPGKLTRLRRVAAEAAKQSGRARVPEVREPVPLTDLRWRGVAWFADPAAEEGVDDATDRLLAGGGAALTVITGPEGGLTACERAELTERGARPVRFGPRVLRAETAPVALAAAVLARVDA